MIKIGIDYGLINWGYCIIYNKEVYFSGLLPVDQTFFKDNMRWLVLYILDNIMSILKSNKNLENKPVKFFLEDYNFYKPNTNSKKLCQLVAVLKFYIENNYKYEVKLVPSSFTKRYVNTFRDFIKTWLGLPEIPYNQKNSHIYDAFAIANYVPKQTLEQYAKWFDND